MRIVIAEDSVLFREGLARLLTEAGHEIVAAVGDAVALVAAAHEHRPDLCVVDVRMPPGLEADGARAAQVLRQEMPLLPILLLSQHVETRHCVPLVGSGAFGYLLKDRVLRVDDFLDAVRRVAAGGSALDPAVVGALMARGSGNTALSALSEREGEVLSLVAEGRSNVAIARALMVTERTVETHMRSVFAKLRIDDERDNSRRVKAVLAYLAGDRRLTGPA